MVELLEKAGVEDEIIEDEGVLTLVLDVELDDSDEREEETDDDPVEDTELEGPELELLCVEDDESLDEEPGVATLVAELDFTDELLKVEILLLRELDDV